jgi:RNA:NAD 2'-phosphotransferase (TPT1/KptA family)
LGGRGGEMTQALYAHMNKRKKMLIRKKKKEKIEVSHSVSGILSTQPETLKVGLNASMKL